MRKIFLTSISVFSILMSCSLGINLKETININNKNIYDNSIVINRMKNRAKNNIMNDLLLKKNINTTNFEIYINEYVLNNKKNKKFTIFKIFI